MAGTVEAIQRRAATDAAFRGALLADPRATLGSMGFSVPDGVEVTVIEATKTWFPLVIPPPTERELTEEQLRRVSGGVAQAVQVDASGGFQ